MDFVKVEKQILDFLEKSLKETSCDNFIVGVSGGIDSAVVSALCSKTGIKTYGLILPSECSDPIHMIHAIEHCEQFNISYGAICITPVMKGFKALVGGFTDQRKGNVAARMRMTMLYDHSAKENGVVVGTSNLSERMLGYGTIYGDLACAFNPIGEIFKTEIFEFARYLKINDEIINKAPSADLWKDQSDEKELGYTYKELDSVLMQIYKKEYDENDLKSRFGDDIVDFVLKRIKNNKFKLCLPGIAEVRS